MRDQTADTLRGMVDVGEQMGETEITVTRAELKHLLDVYDRATQIIGDIEALHESLGMRRRASLDQMIEDADTGLCHTLAQLENLIQKEVS